MPLPFHEYLKKHCRETIGWNFNFLSWIHQPNHSSEEEKMILFKSEFKLIEALLVANEIVPCRDDDDDLHWMQSRWLQNADVSQKLISPRMFIACSFRLNSMLKIVHGYCQQWFDVLSVAFINWISKYSNIEATAKNSSSSSGSRTYFVEFHFTITWTDCLWEKRYLKVLQVKAFAKSGNK